jgi:hypothetical protein
MKSRYMNNHSTSNLMREYVGYISYTVKQRSKGQNMSDDFFHRAFSVHGIERVFIELNLSFIMGLQSFTETKGVGTKQTHKLLGLVPLANYTD